MRSFLYISDCMCTCLGVDNRVVNVIGYLPSTSIAAAEVFGIDWMLKAVVMSEDGGLTWVSVSIKYYTASKLLPGFHAAKSVPWVGTATLPTGTPNSPYTDGSWGGKWTIVYTHILLKKRYIRNTTYLFGLEEEGEEEG